MIKINSLMIVDIGAIMANASSSNLLLDGQGVNNIILFPGQDNPFFSGAGDDILVGSQNNNTLNGGEGNDIVAGLGGNDYLLGGGGNDTVTGGGISFMNDSLFITVDSSGIDTLTGGSGADLFVIGGQSLNEAETAIIHYDEAGNNDYALITDFNKLEDTINLGGAKSNYHLGSSPNNLPTGTALYLGSELIAIIQGSSQLSLDDSYFQGST
ncbi:MAG: calcium-binding protein [Xenococcaceae cyanobacterium]